MSGRRANAGGQVDRTRTIRFTFDGKPMTGHAGDTLASALLAGASLLTQQVAAQRVVQNWAWIKAVAPPLSDQSMAVTASPPTASPGPSVGPRQTPSPEPWQTPSR